MSRRSAKRNRRKRHWGFKRRRRPKKMSRRSAKRNRRKRHWGFKRRRRPKKMSRRSAKRNRRKKRWELKRRRRPKKMSRRSVKRNRRKKRWGFKRRRRPKMRMLKRWLQKQQRWWQEQQRSWKCMRHRKGEMTRKKIPTNHQKTLERRKQKSKRLRPMQGTCATTGTSGVHILLPHYANASCHSILLSLH